MSEKCDLGTFVVVSGLILYECCSIGPASGGYSSPTSCSWSLFNFFFFSNKISAYSSGPLDS